MSRAEWRPIETALTDRRILVWSKYGILVVSWDGEYDYWIEPASGRSLSHTACPTHWMPLPDPPREQAPE
jgi:hypothetical protein